MNPISNPNRNSIDAYPFAFIICFLQPFLVSPLSDGPWNTNIMKAQIITIIIIIID